MTVSTWQICPCVGLFRVLLSADIACGCGHGPRADAPPTPGADLRTAFAAASVRARVGGECSKGRADFSGWAGWLSPLAHHSFNLVLETRVFKAPLINFVLVHFQE